MESQTKNTMQRKITRSDLTAYLFISLFMYTAAAKVFSIKKFASTLAKSPLIGDWNHYIAWAVPITEIVISVLLIIALTRKLGLYASLALMIIFTLYLSYMVLSAGKLPCHCGGVISKMSWQEHIWFNLAFIALAIMGLCKFRK